MKINLLITGTILAIASMANATVVLTETFDYTPGPTGVEGAGGALDTLIANGYDHNGKGGYNLRDVSDPAQIVFDEVPNANPFGYQGQSSLRLFSGRVIHDKDSLVGLGDTVGTTYYFSLAYEYQSTSAFDSGVDFYLGGDALQLSAGVVGPSGNEIAVQIGPGDGGFTFNVGNRVSVLTGTEYYILGSFTVTEEDATNYRYTINASVFDSASIASIPGTEPATWDSSMSITADKTNGLVSGHGFSSWGGTGDFESLRVGTTYESVAVPEPSTYALLAGFATLGLVLLRRRLKA